jgi:PAS domain S-box-containing protein
MTVASTNLDDGPSRLPYARTAHQEFRKLRPGRERWFDHLQDGVVALDERHRIIYANAAAARLYGFDAREVCGEGFGELTVCHWPPVPLGMLEDGGWSGQFKQVTSAGLEIHVDVSIVGAQDVPAGARFIAIVHQRAQEELAIALHEHQRFDALLSGLSAQFSGLLEEEVDQAIESGMLRLMQFLGAGRSSIAELMADGRMHVTHTCALAGVKKTEKGPADLRFPWLVNELRQGRDVVVPAVRHLPAEATDLRAMMADTGMKSGIAIPLHIGDALICVLTFGIFAGERDWPGELIARLRVAGEIFANAIARRQAKERLQRKQQEFAHLGRVVAMNELASVIAHELDQPLTAIISNAQAGRLLLARAEPDLAESKAALDDIIADSIRASEILGRQRRLIRREKQNVERVDLSDVVLEVEMFIRADARQHGSAVKFELPSQLPAVRADRIEVQQVLLNLTRNGIQAMSSQPREQRVLRIRTCEAGAEVLLEVVDAGPPIDESQLRQIFEPFFTTKKDGLGIGLSISRSIVQNHRGRMWASRNPGGGLTMHVALPAEVQHGGK